MEWSDRRDLRSLGNRMLLTLLLYNLGAALIGGLLLSVPFMKQIMPEILEKAADGLALTAEDILPFMNGFIKDHEQLIYTLSYAASAVCALLAILFFLPRMRKERPVKAHYASNGLSIVNVILFAVGALGIANLSSLILMGTEWAFNLADLSVLLNIPYQSGVVYYLYAIIIAPVCEEWIFRGGLMRGLKPYGEKFALTASAVCFAFFHGNLEQFPTTLLLGFWFGYISLRTDSLLGNTLAHMLYNAFAVTLSMVAVSETASFAVFLIGLAAGLVAVRSLIRKMGSLDPTPTEKPLQNQFYFSFPMLVFFAFSLYTIIGTISALE